MSTLSKVRKENPLPLQTDLGQLANDFGEFFHRKIELFRTEIDDIPVQTPSVEYQPPKAELTSFRQLTEEEIRDIIMNSSNATCKLDPIPTWLVKLCVDELKTVITKIFNMSLHDGYVPEAWKVALLQWRNSYELYPVRSGGTQTIGFPGEHPELSCPGALFISFPFRTTIKNLAY